MSQRRSASPRRRRAVPASQPIRPDRIDNGRVLAFRVLQLHDSSGRFASDLLADLDPEHSLSRQERGQAIDVVAGTIRRRRTIDMLLQSQVKRPRAEVEPDLWRILQCGVQQLCFGRTPDHAAVDATVELTRILRRPQWTGFVNGVLRNVARLLTDETVDEPSRSRLPLVDGLYRQLNAEVFSCPVTDTAAWFGEAFSMPRAIARRWHSRMSLADLTAAGFHSLGAPSTTLRVNPLRATVTAVVEALSAAGITTEPGTSDQALRLLSPGKIEDLPGYDEGHWTIQDDSAMAASQLLDPQPGETILDLCAAPGGKTTHLAELSGDQAVIYAADVNESRLKRVEDSLARLRLKSVRPLLIDRDGSGLPDIRFDAVLVDVPCSNTGVLCRRPEARWRFRESELEELTRLQTRLLMTAFDHLRPDGRLVYSTCSIEPDETSDLIRSVVQAVPAMTLESEQLVLPGRPADGAYTALIRRTPTAADATDSGPQS